MPTFVASKDALARVRGATSIAPLRPNIPILSHLLLKGDESGVTAIANDLDRMVTVRIPGEGDGEWRATVPAQIIGGIAQQAAGDVSFRSNGKAGEVHVEYGLAKHRLAGLEVDDFPEMIPEEGAACFEIDAAQLRYLFARTAHAMGNAIDRASLMGVHLSGGSGHLIAEATSGHTLAQVKLAIGAPDASCIVPRNTVKLLLQILARQEGVAKVTIGERLIDVDLGTVSVRSKLVDGTFPECDRLIPPANPVATIDVTDMLKGVEIVSCTAENAIRVTLRDGRVSIATKDVKAGESSFQVQGEFDGDPIEFGVWPQLLSDALRALPDNTETAMLSVDNPGAPIRLDPVGHDDCLFMVMPWRI